MSNFSLQYTYIILQNGNESTQIYWVEVILN